MPTRHHRIQVTEDPELADALRAAEPHLPPGLPRSQAVRELAIAGARQLAAEPLSESRRQQLLEQLAEHFEKPETAPWDWEALREGKGKGSAWPSR